MAFSFAFNFSEIPAVISTLTNFIKDNFLLFAIMFVSYFLFYIYTFINNKAVDTDVYEIDLLSNGVSTMMVSFLLIGLDESSKGFNLAALNFGNPTTRIALYLFIYAIVLILFAFIKALPRFLVILLGNSELDLFINVIAVLLSEPKIVITGTLIAVIGAPLVALFVIQRIRRFMM